MMADTNTCPVHGVISSGSRIPILTGKALVRGIKEKGMDLQTNRSRASQLGLPFLM